MNPVDFRWLKDSLWGLPMAWLLGSAVVAVVAALVWELLERHDDEPPRGQLGL
jgi:hypothetical protein